MVRHSRLLKANLFGDVPNANAVIYQIPIYLWREMALRIGKPMRYA
jgi:hypothetical protein